MKKINEGAWLGQQIDSAKQSLDLWPEWMKRAAHFEGSDFSSSTPNRSQATGKQVSGRPKTEKQSP